MIPAKPVGRGPFAIELLKPTPTDRVLDEGCFNGALEYHFLDGNVAEWHGIDANEEAIKHALAWHGAKPTVKSSFQTAYAETIPFADGYFDKILCLDVFEHVGNEEKVAAELYRVLKPGGTLVLSVPHDFLNFLDPDELTRSARNFVRRYVRKRPLLTHDKHRHYSLSQLKRYFNAFRIDQVHRCGTPLFWAFAMAYTGLGLPERITRSLSSLTAPIENWDYRTPLPTGFNIMIRATKI